MPAAKLSRLRTALWTFHRWIGLGLALLLVPIAVSGALLVWHDQLDAVIHPGRYAVSGKAVTQPPSSYLASATTALAGGAEPTAVRFPASEGWPVVVNARASNPDGGRPRTLNVYLDPADAQVLDVVDVRTSLFGWLHRFHENLTVPDYSGRAVVGWVGVGMLILSLSGIWLWWPRNGAFLPGLRWGRTAQTTTNLHHLLGFWISIPLAVVSATGIYLGFPQNARLVMSSIAPMTPQGQRPGLAAVARDTKLTPDSALAAARAALADAQPAILFLPTAAGGRRARGEQAAPGDEGPIWRIQLRKSDETITLTVNDRTGAVARLPDPLAGDRAAQWIRAIHEGSRGGPVWQAVVFLTGVFPAVFAVTGLLMWLRGRSSRRAVKLAQTRLQAAE
jgi:uncharacterized iron-regulated membrane protein